MRQQRAVDAGQQRYHRANKAQVIALENQLDNRQVFDGCNNID